MLIKFTNTNIRFRRIREEDFTSIGFDGQEGINIDVLAHPYVDLPDPIAQWLLDNEPKDWERADGVHVVAPVPAEVPDAFTDDGEGKSKKK